MNIPLEEILKEIGIAGAVSFSLFTAVSYLDNRAQRKAREYKIKKILDYAKFYNGLQKNNKGE